MISVLILTFNEEQNLSSCLESVQWSDDVLVLDSFSTDRTLEVARAAGVRTLQNRFVNFAEQRNLGIDQAGFKYDWVLHLDADERVTPELREELLQVVARAKKKAYRLSSKTMFGRVWLKRSGLFPSYQVRLGRRESLRFKMVGHGQRETLGPAEVGTLQNSLLHFSFAKGLPDWFAKHRRYAAAEAEENLKHRSSGSFSFARLFSSDPLIRRRALKEFSTRLPCRPALRFFYMYIVRMGFLDGKAGFTYCRLLSIYEGMIVARTRALREEAKRASLKPTSL